MAENYPDKLDKQLIDAFNALKGTKEMENFLRDILTLKEIKEVSKRLEVARLLWTTDMPYKKIAAQVKTSTTTVTRVNDWLNNKGLKGYQTILKRLFSKS